MTNPELRVKRFWEKVNKDGPTMPHMDTPCWIWLGTYSSNGYSSVTVNGRGTTAYRLSWLIHSGEIPDNLFVLHKCDNPKCVNPTHLFLGTHGDNMRDMFAKGRWKVKQNKLNKRVADQIRDFYATGCYTQQDLARLFNVHQGTISYVIRRKIWI